MIFPPKDRAVASAFRCLVYCNPFKPERVDYERQILGDQFVPLDAPWNVMQDVGGERPNLAVLRKKAEELAHMARARLIRDIAASDQEMELYEDLVVYLLFDRFADRLPMNIPQTDLAGHSVVEPVAKPMRERFTAYPDFVRHVRHYLQLPGRSMPVSYEPAHLLALFFQIRRAFHHIFTHVAGRSLAAARLRASIWESVFTHDMARYRRCLHHRMADFTTLITGPSGTGKELVARAIALSRYIPFDEKGSCFVEDFTGSFFALSLSALSPTLIESELFGHRRGAFTGALEDRAGWLETCPSYGTVFLDEIGEVDGPIQVKLLRVLQDRVFQRLGDTRARHFQGKILAATHRDLTAEMAANRFRRDFYYRLCSDMIQTPSLQEQLRERPDELRELALFVARREVGEEAETLTDVVVKWVELTLGRDYPWPGNFRELQQCVRNVLVRGEYHPPRSPTADPATDLTSRIREASLSADELLRAYCTSVYALTGSYEETARRIKLDRRTVKSKVDRQSCK